MRENVKRYNEIVRTSQAACLTGDSDSCDMRINLSKHEMDITLIQARYQKRYDTLVARFDKAKARHTEVTDLIASTWPESIRSKPTCRSCGAGSR